MERRRRAPLLARARHPLAAAPDADQRRSERQRRSGDQRRFLQRAPAPAARRRDDGMSAYRRILVAVDGSPAAARGLSEAIRLAKAQGAQLFVLHVVNEFYAYASMEGAGLAADLPA